MSIIGKGNLELGMVGIWLPLQRGLLIRDGRVEELPDLGLLLAGLETSETRARFGQDATRDIHLSCVAVQLHQTCKPFPFLTCFSWNNSGSSGQARHVPNVLSATAGQDDQYLLVLLKSVFPFLGHQPPHSPGIKDQCPLVPQQNEKNEWHWLAKEWKTLLINCRFANCSMVPFFKILNYDARRCLGSGTHNYCHLVIWQLSFVGEN